MKKIILVFYILLFSLLAAKAESGNDAYTPTKLQWLAIAGCTPILSALDTNSNGYSIYCIPKPPNTIEIKTNYTPKTNVETMKYIVESLKENLKASADANKWTWLVIEEKYNKLPE